MAKNLGFLGASVAISSRMAFLPYGRQWIEKDDIDAVVAVLQSDFLTTGPAVASFEGALAAAATVPRAVAVSNGTAALHAALWAAGVGPGDEVVVPAISFVASANAALYVGASVVFADVDPRTGLIDPVSAGTVVGPKTKAIVPVDLTGMPAPLAEIGALAKGVGACVVEDAAHSLGATYQGRPVGADADLATLSFHPVKLITSGEGGAVLASSVRLADRAAQFRDHGIARGPAGFVEPSPGPWYYEQQELGFNLRLSAIQCALGESQLRKLPRFLERRRALAARYDRLLQELGSELLQPLGRPSYAAESAWHLYVAQIDFARAGKSRASVMAALRERGIGTQVHYIPIPAQPYYRALGHDPARFPGALAYYERALSLPMYASMEDLDVDRVVAALAEVLDLSA